MKIGLSAIRFGKREYLEAMRHLWRGNHISYRGEDVSFEDVRSYPKAGISRIGPALLRQDMLSTLP